MFPPGELERGDGVCDTSDEGDGEVLQFDKLLYGGGVELLRTLYPSSAVVGAVGPVFDVLEVNPAAAAAAALRAAIALIGFGE